MAKKKKTEPEVTEEEIEAEEEVEIDLEEIRELAGEGNTQEDIADVLGVSVDIFDRADVQDAYRVGMSDMRVSLRHMQYQCAKSGNVSMLTWLGKIYLGQKEETVNTVNLVREDDALTKSLENLAAEMDAEKE